MQQNTQKINKPKLTRVEAARVGAMALNSDPVKKRAAILKGLETKRRKKLAAKMREVTREQMLNQYQNLQVHQDKL